VKILNPRVKAALVEAPLSSRMEFEVVIAYLEIAITNNIT